MTRDCPTVDGWLNLQNFVDEKFLRTGHRCFVVVEKGEITGRLRRMKMKEVDRAKWPYTTVHDIMRPLDDLRAVTPDAPLDKRAGSDGPLRSEPASRHRQRASRRSAVASPNRHLFADTRGAAPVVLRFGRTTGMPQKAPFARTCRLELKSQSELYLPRVFGRKDLSEC